MKAYLLFTLSLFCIISNAKTIITADISDITASSANLCATVNMRIKPGAEYDAGFIISKNVPIEQNVKEVILHIDNHMFDKQFSKYAMGLESNTVYNVKAFIRIKKKEYYSETIQFCTKEILAEIKTKEASNISEFKATLIGHLSLGDEFMGLKKEVFFLYSSKTSDFSSLIDEGTKVKASDLGNNSYESVIKELEPKTTYFYVICSKIHDKWFYGSVCSFQTADIIIQIQENNAIDVGITKATLTCKINIESIENLTPNVYFLVSDFKDFSQNQQRIDAYIQNGDVYCADAIELRNATRYYYKACIQINNSMAVSSEIGIFTTQNFPLKKYSGPYHGGFATYTYFEKEDESRIYHGRFEYSIKKYKRDIEIIGFFNNGKRDSVWVFKTKNIEKSVYLPNDERMTISYKDGIHDGPLSYIASKSYAGKDGRGDAVTTKNGDQCAPNGLKCSVTFVNNEPVGLLEFSALDGRRWELRYDSEGDACGIWKYCTRIEDYFIDYDSDKVIEYYIDKERGEKHYLSVGYSFLSEFTFMIDVFHARCKRLDDICEPYPSVGRYSPITL